MITELLARRRCTYIVTSYGFGRAALLALCLAIAGTACTDDEPRAPVASGSPTEPGTGTRGAGECPIRPVGTAEAGSVSTPGPHPGVEPSRAGGDRLVIAAMVLDAACRPATGASISLWHTDARGLYGPDGDPENGLYYQDDLRTDSDGRFGIDTIRPAQYPEPGAPPAHIHFEMRHPTGQLMTEILLSETSVTATTARSQHAVDVGLESRTDATGSYWYGETTIVLEP